MNYNSSLKNIYLHKNKFMFLASISLIILYSFQIFKNGIDNDFYFLYKTGENIIENGFPTIDSLTMHEGFNITVQQWLSDVIFFVIYKYVGKIGLLIFISIIFATINIFTYKILIGISNGNDKIAMFSTLFAAYLYRVTFTTRPFTFTFLFCLIAINLLYRYSATGNKRLLIGLPILSVLQINFHASMWIFLIIMVLPFLFESISYKKLRIKGFHYVKYPAIPLLLAFISMILTALINPYTYKNVIYVFDSVNKYSTEIVEMTPASLDYLCGIITFAILLIIIFMLLYGGRSFNIKLVCYFLGGTILVLYANKCFVYFVLFSIMLIADYFKDIELHFEKIKLYKFLFGAIVILYAFMATKAIVDTSPLKKDDNMHNAVNFLAANHDVKNKKTYTSFYNGAYAEFMGIKPYIDPRAEVFLKIQNMKEDIWYEYIDLQNYRINPQNFIHKYDFDYILLETTDALYRDYRYHPETYSNYALIYDKDGYIILKKKR